MNEELINKIITYNYNEFGNEFGDVIVDLKQKVNELENINNKLSSALNSAEQRIDKANKILKNWKSLDLDNLLKAIKDVEKILKGKK